MNAPRKLTLDETIAAAIRMGAIDEIIQKTLAMSDEEINRELEEDGVDLNELDDRLAAMGEKLFGQPRPVRMNRRFATGFGAGVVSTGAVLAALARAGVFATVPAVVSLAGSGAPETGANLMRQSAYNHCAVGEFQECLDLLDKAKEGDPDSDREVAVQKVRAYATRMLAQSKDGGL